jgi:hypothetical protein
MRKSLWQQLRRSAIERNSTSIPTWTAGSATRAIAIFLLLACGACRTSAQVPPTEKPTDNWPCFRGVDRKGVAPPDSESVPLPWSDTKNIVWKRKLPGRGASSPIVWGDNVYVTAYSGYGLEAGDPPANMSKLVRHLLCVDRTSGDLRWKADEPSDDVAEHPLSEFLILHGYASSTPVADESGVYVYLGRGGVVAYDHAGKRLWHSPIGGGGHTWGSAASPVLFGNLVIVHADPDAHAVIALDKNTGEEVWRYSTGDGDSWSTPLVVEVDGRSELVFHHSAGDPAGKVAAVDPRTGEALWQCDILKNYLCPSPVASDGVVYFLGFQRAAAVRPGGKGDVTDSHVLWTGSRGAEIATPIVHNGHLYWAQSEGGIVCCLDAKTGEMVHQERLRPEPGRMYASGVLVGERIYFVSRENGTYVVEASPECRQLAHNRIESDTSIFNATPAICGGQLFLRSDRFLYCIGEK